MNTSYLFSPTAKVLRLGRLQHGQGQDEEASCGGARQEPGDWRPHSHAAGPAPEEVLLGDQQASRLASTILQAPSLPTPTPRGSRQTSLTRVPDMSVPSPLFPFHPQAPLALTCRAELYKLKLHFACMWVGRGGRDGGHGGPARSQPSLPSRHAQLCPLCALCSTASLMSWFSVFQDASQ